ncbi:MAG TPA: hypothetical protein VM238_15560 [Phycisphaerae bacterium]|nr:hypothetical protein [Phycisphaerae bacterium]
MRQTRFVAYVAALALVTTASVLQGEEAGPAGTLKGDLPPAQYSRVVNPIEAKVALAEKAMELYEKEMEKPAEKRRAAMLISYKEKASAAYYQVALAARKAIKMVKKEEHKAEIKATYEDPNLSKATEIPLGFASEAQNKGDVRTAVGYYKRVLAMDPNNPVATAALEKIARTMQKTQEKGPKERDKKKDDKDTPSWKRTGR